MSAAARVLAGVLAAAALAAGPAAGGAAVSRSSIAAKAAAVDATRRALADARGDLAARAARERDLRGELAATDAGIVRVTDDLAALDRGLASARGRVAANSVQLAAARATLRLHDRALDRRLVDAYERGDLGYVNVLLSSTSFADFVERWDDIRYLVAANQRTVRERRAAEGAVARAQATYERRRIALDALDRRARRSKYQLAALAVQRTELVTAAAAARRQTAVRVAALEDLTAAQEAALEALIRERQREEAVRIAAENEARRRAAQLAGAALPAPDANAPPGAFAWPVSGPITSPFGMRADPFGHGFQMHPGIDIGAPMGATITASAAGRVIWAKWYGGYGNAIIVDDGGGLSTLYGHCSQIFVADGQQVARGQAIGAVGSTGESTGPHLHFEIRENGRPVEPTSRLR